MSKHEKALRHQRFFMLFLHPRAICCQVLGEVGDDVALHGHGRGGVREAGGGGGIDAGGAVDEVGVEPGGADLLVGELPGELVDDGADHFEVAQLLGADVR